MTNVNELFSFGLLFSNCCQCTTGYLNQSSLDTTLCQFFINHISLSILKWNVKVKLERLNYKTVNSKTKMKCHLFLCLHPLIHSLNSIRKKVAFMFLSPLAVLFIFTSNTFLHFHSCCQDWWQRFWLKHFLLSVHASIFLKTGSPLLVTVALGRVQPQSRCPFFPGNFL